MMTVTLNKQQNILGMRGRQFPDLLHRFPDLPHNILNFQFSTKTYRHTKKNRKGMPRHGGGGGGGEWTETFSE